MPQESTMTAAELAELWEPLAAREPGLRPEHVAFVAFDADSNPSDTVAVCAALWRDAAVRWLMKRDGWVALHEPMDAAQGFGVQHEYTDNTRFGPTLDHALADAVKAVLDAAVTTGGS